MISFQVEIVDECRLELDQDLMAIYDQLHSDPIHTLCFILFLDRINGLNLLIPNTRASAEIHLLPDQNL